MVTRDAVLAALKRASVRPVTVAGLELHVRGVSGAERKALIDRARANEPMQAYELAALCLCDADGHALFTADDVAALADTDGDSLEKIGAAILTASGLMPSAESDAAKN